MFLPFHFAAYFAVGIAFFDCLALIEFLFAARDCDAYFQLASFIIHRDWYDCQSFLGFTLGEVMNFFFGQKQLAISAFVVALWRVLWLIGGDVRADEKHFAPADNNVRTFKRAELCAK